MSLSVEEAVHEGVTAILESYHVRLLENHSTAVSLEIIVHAGLEALEDFVVNATNGKQTFMDIIG